MTGRLRVVTLALVGTLLLSAAGGCASSGVRRYLAGNYTEVSRQDQSVRYEANKRPDQVARDIRKASRPNDTLDRGGEHYLRYSDDIVAVKPRSGGSTVVVDDEDDGYRRWYPIIAPVWGPNRGPGGIFRGGGPGSGK